MKKVLVFSGLDCAGKSTQIDILEKTYLELGEKSFVFWSRGGYTPGFQFLKDCIRFFLKGKAPDPGHNKGREKAFSNPFVRKTWIIIAILDLILFYGIYLRFKYLMNNNIICDRYLIDTLIDFKIAFPKEKLETKMLWRLLELIALKPDFNFVCTIPVSESVVRSRQKFEPFPDSPEVLKQRLTYYKQKIDSNKNLIHIDGMQSKTSIKKDIFYIITAEK